MSIIYSFILTLSLQNFPDRAQNVDFWVKNLSSSSLDVRIISLQKLAEIRNDSSLPAIAQSLQAPNPELRFYAAKSLSKFLNEAALQILSDHLATEKDVYVKAEVNRSIRKIQEVIERQQALEE